MVAENTKVSELADKIQKIYDSLADDPEYQAEGEKSREEVILNEATQRAMQHERNNEALGMLNKSSLFEFTDFVEKAKSTSRRPDLPKYSNTPKSNLLDTIDAFLEGANIEGSWEELAGWDLTTFLNYMENDGDSEDITALAAELESIIKQERHLSKALEEKTKLRASFANLQAKFIEDEQTGSLDEEARQYADGAWRKDLTDLGVPADHIIPFFDSALIDEKKVELSEQLKSKVRANKLDENWYEDYMERYGGIGNLGKMYPKPLPEEYSDEELKAFQQQRRAVGRQKSNLFNTYKAKYGHKLIPDENSSFKHQQDFKNLMYDYNYSNEGRLIKLLKEEKLITDDQVSYFENINSNDERNQIELNLIDGILANEDDTADLINKVLYDTENLIEYKSSGHSRSSDLDEINYDEYNNFNMDTETKGNLENYLRLLQGIDGIDEVYITGPAADISTQRGQLSAEDGVHIGFKYSEPTAIKGVVAEGAEETDRKLIVPDVIDTDPDVGELSEISYQADGNTFTYHGQEMEYDDIAAMTPKELQEGVMSGRFKFINPETAEEVDNEDNFYLRQGEEDASGMVITDVGLDDNGRPLAPTIQDTYTRDKKNQRRWVPIRGAGEMPTQGNFKKGDIEIKTGSAVRNETSLEQHIVNQINALEIEPVEGITFSAIRGTHTGEGTPKTATEKEWGFVSDGAVTYTDNPTEEGFDGIPYEVIPHTNQYVLDNPKAFIRMGMHRGNKDVFGTGVKPETPFKLDAETLSQSLNELLDNVITLEKVSHPVSEADVHKTISNEYKDSHRSDRNEWNQRNGADGNSIISAAIRGLEERKANMAANENLNPIAKKEGPKLIDGKIADLKKLQAGWGLPEIQDENGNKVEINPSNIDDATLDLIMKAPVDMYNRLQKGSTYTDSDGTQKTQYKIHDDEIGLLNLQAQQKAQIQKAVKEEMGDSPEGMEAVKFEDGIRKNIVINGPNGETHILGAIVGNTIYPTNPNGEIESTAEGVALTKDQMSSHNWLNDIFNFENLFAEGSEVTEDAQKLQELFNTLPVIDRIDALNQIRKINIQSKEILNSKYNTTNMRTEVVDGESVMREIPWEHSVIESLLNGKHTLNDMSPDTPERNVELGGQLPLWGVDAIRLLNKSTSQLDDTRLAELLRDFPDHLADILKINELTNNLDLITAFNQKFSNKSGPTKRYDSSGVSFEDASNFENSDVPFEIFGNITDAQRELLANNFYPFYEGYKNAAIEMGFDTETPVRDMLKDMGLYNLRTNADGTSRHQVSPAALCTILPKRIDDWSGKTNQPGYEGIPMSRRLEYVDDVREGAKKGAKAFRVATYRKIGDEWVKDFVKEAPSQEEKKKSRKGRKFNLAIKTGKKKKEPVTINNEVSQDAYDESYIQPLNDMIDSINAGEVHYQDDPTNKVEIFPDHGGIPRLATPDGMKAFIASLTGRQGIQKNGGRYTTTIQQVLEVLRGLDTHDLENVDVTNLRNTIDASEPNYEGIITQRAYEQGIVKELQMYTSEEEYGVLTHYIKASKDHIYKTVSQMVEDGTISESQRNQVENSHINRMLNELFRKTAQLNPDVRTDWDQYNFGTGSDPAATEAGQVDWDFEPERGFWRVPSPTALDWENKIELNETPDQQAYNSLQKARRVIAYDRWMAGLSPTEDIESTYGQDDVMTETPTGYEKSPKAFGPDQAQGFYSALADDYFEPDHMVIIPDIIRDQNKVLDKMPEEVQDALRGYNLSSLRESLDNIWDQPDNTEEIREFLDQYDDKLNEIVKDQSVHVVKQEDGTYNLYEGDPKVQEIKPFMEGIEYGKAMEISKGRPVWNSETGSFNSLDMSNSTPVVTSTPSNTDENSNDLPMNTDYLKSLGIRSGFKAIIEDESITKEILAEMLKHDDAGILKTPNRSKAAKDFIELRKADLAEAVEEVTNNQNSRLRIREATKALNDFSEEVALNPRYEWLKDLGWDNPDNRGNIQVMLNDFSVNNGLPSFLSLQQKGDKAVITADGMKVFKGIMEGISQGWDTFTLADGSIIDIDEALLEPLYNAIVEYGDADASAIMSKLWNYRNPDEETEANHPDLGDLREGNITLPESAPSQREYIPTQPTQTEEQVVSEEPEPVPTAEQLAEQELNNVRDALRARDLGYPDDVINEMPLEDAKQALEAGLRYEAPVDGEQVVENVPEVENIPEDPFKDFNKKPSKAALEYLESSEIDIDPLTKDIEGNYIFDGATLNNVKRRAEVVQAQQQQEGKEETPPKLPPTPKAKRELTEAGFDPTKEEFAGMTVAQAREYIKGQQVEEGSPVQRQQSKKAADLLTAAGLDPTDEMFAGWDAIDARNHIEGLNAAKGGDASGDGGKKEEVTTIDDKDPLPFNGLDEPVETPIEQPQIKTGRRRGSLFQQTPEEGSDESFILTDSNGRKALALVGGPGSYQWALVADDGTVDPSRILTEEDKELFDQLVDRDEFRNLEELRVQANRNEGEILPTLKILQDAITSKELSDDMFKALSDFRIDGLDVNKQKIEEIMKAKFGDDWKYDSWSRRDKRNGQTPRGFYELLLNSTENKIQNYYEDIVKDNYTGGASDIMTNEERQDLIADIKRKHQEAFPNAPELEDDFLDQRTVKDLRSDYEKYDESVKRKVDAEASVTMRRNAKQLLNTLQQQPLADNTSVDDLAQMQRNLIGFMANYLHATDMDNNLVIEEKDELREIHSQLMETVRKHPNYGNLDEVLKEELGGLNRENPQESLENWVNENEEKLNAKRENYKQFQEFIAGYSKYDYPLPDSGLLRENAAPVIMGLDKDSNEYKNYEAYHREKIKLNDIKKYGEVYGVREIENQQRFVAELEKACRKDGRTDDQLNLAGQTKADRQLKEPTYEEATAAMPGGNYDPELHAMVHPDLAKHKEAVQANGNSGVLYRNHNLLIDDDGQPLIVPLEGSPLQNDPSIILDHMGNILHVGNNSNVPDEGAALYPDELNSIVLGHQVAADMDNNPNEAYIANDGSEQPIVALELNESGNFQARPPENLDKLPQVQENTSPPPAEPEPEAQQTGGSPLGAAARFLQSVEMRRRPSDIAPSVMQRASVIRSLKNITRDFLNTPFGLIESPLGGLIPKSKTDLFVEGMNNYAQQRYDERKFIEDNKHLIPTVVNPAAGEAKKQQVLDWYNENGIEITPIMQEHLNDPKNVDSEHSRIAREAAKPKPEPTPKPPKQDWNPETGEWEDVRTEPTPVPSAVDQFSAFTQPETPTTVESGTASDAVPPPPTGKPVDPNQATFDFMNDPEIKNPKEVSKK